MNKKQTILFAVFAVLFAACRPATEQKKAEIPAAPASAPEPVAAAPSPAPDGAALLAPEKAVEKAPEVYKARFSTTKGDFVIEVHRAWAPQGADRFYNLVKIGYYNDVAFFRVLKGFMAQIGIHGSPEVSAKWRSANIPDDPASGQSNKRGYVSYATAGPNTRTTQFFINYENNSNLDSMGFTPFGFVSEGMEAVQNLYGGYGEGAPQGGGPDQNRIQMEGNSYLKKDFPQLDWVKSASLGK